MPWRNRVELAGIIASAPERRRTPAGTAVAFFRLRVDPSPDDPAVAGCVVPVVCLGSEAVHGELDEGREATVEGSLTERRWRGAGGVSRSRFEILARTVRVM